MSKKKAKAPPTRQQQQDAVRAKRATARGHTGQGSTATAAAVMPAAATPPPVARPAASGQAVTYEYLDVGAVRIQDWLGRTPSLKLRRGASVLLSEATADDAWAENLPPGATLNPEAGHIDGVVSLRWPACGTDPGGEPAPDPRTVAAGVIRALRTRLPNVPIRATRAQATSYIEAYPQMEEARSRGQYVADAPAAPSEVILAKPCGACLQSPAERPGVTIITGEKPKDLCPECWERLVAGGGTKGSWEKRSPLPERRMRAAIRDLGHDVHFPDDFYEQAAGAPAGVPPGGGREHTTNTQLALIYADGNQVGAFLRKAAAHARKTGSPRKSDIVTALDAATMTALGHAVVETFLSRPGTCPHPAKPPVLAHLAGGDDLMVTVPAAHGWEFTRHLLQAFGQELASLAGTWGMTGQELPSLSAGLVFHHYSHPFNDAVTLAGTRLKNAKNQTRGAHPAVDFLDLTADGADPPAHRTVCGLDWLGRHAAVLGGLAGVPASHRHTLIDQHRHTLTGRPAVTVPSRDAVASGAETPEQAFARRVIDRGEPALRRAAEAALGVDDLSSAELRTTLAGDADARGRLRQLLDMARWWPDREETP